MYIYDIQKKKEAITLTYFIFCSKASSVKLNFFLRFKYIYLLSPPSGYFQCFAFQAKKIITI